MWMSSGAVNCIQNGDVDELKSELCRALPAQQARLRALRAQHGLHEIQPLTVQSVLGGMRGSATLLCQTSSIDAQQGLRIRGYSLPELQVLPMQLRR